SRSGDIRVRPSGCRPPGPQPQERRPPMRHVGMKLAAFLAAVAVLAPAADRLPAQPPGPPAGQPQPPAPNKLDEHLGEWAKRMGGLVNFHAKFKLTRTEATFQK